MGLIIQMMLSEVAKLRKVPEGTSIDEIIREIGFDKVELGDTKSLGKDKEADDSQ